MDKVVHFEIPADDVKRAQKFYGSVFGWSMNDVPGMDYTLISTVETDEKRMPKEPGAINGGMMKRMDPIKSPVITISVTNLEDSINKVERSSGKLVVPKMKVGDIGYSAYVRDTEGNIIGLWQDIKPSG